MYINADVWEAIKYSQRGRGIVKEAQELSAVVEAIAIGIAVAEIYCLAYNETKRYLEHVNRRERFKAKQRESEKAAIRRRGVFVAG